MKAVKFTINTDKQSVYKNLLFALLLALSSIFLIWKCRYGFGNIDESFYLTIPYRLFKGDALFLHEWHLSQMASVLTLPIVSLYLSIKGSTEGIVLFMRYACTVVQIATALFVYVRLKKINWLGATLSSISYVLYIPFGIMAFSYNSMAIMALVICMVIILTAEKMKALQYVIAGLFYAAAVLCCPYLAVVFFVYVFAVLVAGLVRRKKNNTSEKQFYFFTSKGAVCLSVGTIIAALTFAIFVFSRASLTGILKAFPSIMNDPEHPPLSIFRITKTYIASILVSNSLAKFVYPLLAVLFCICIADKKRNEHRSIYLCIASLCTLALMLGYYFINSYINFIMWPINVLAFFIVILSKEKSIRNIFCSFWVIGILYSYCLNATSNQTFYAISSASSVSLVGSIMIVCIFLKGLLEKNNNIKIKNVVVILISTVMALQIFMQVGLRYKSVFWETDMKSQNVLIEDGFNAGLYVTEEKHQMYYSSLESLKALEEYDAENVLYLSENTWYYLVGDYNMSTYSAWLSGVKEHSVERLKAYFEINPEKMPDVVYVEKKYEEIATLFCNTFGYKVDKNDTAIILVK